MVSNNGHAFFSGLAINVLMKMTGWRERLLDQADKDGRSFNAISKAAGVHRNTLSELRTLDKSPSIDNFVKLCRELNASVTYVLIGVELSRQDEELLSLLGTLEENKREAFEAFLRSLIPVS